MRGERGEGGRDGGRRRDESERKRGEGEGKREIKERGRGKKNGSSRCLETFFQLVHG